MTDLKFEEISNEGLVKLFEDGARAQGGAVLSGDVTAAGQIYWDLEAVDKELRSLGPVARRQLLKLLDHSELSVRYYAAKKLLALEPVKARAII